MNKNNFALTPPMGWNSYDYYNTMVTEGDIKKNAGYMATHLKPFGYEYVVIDIEWYAYDTGTQLEKYQYIPFSKFELDSYGRLLPCPDRFPSSVNGAGFKPLADYLHSLGLKFGIHIMRGIPRVAAAEHMPILNSTQTANEVADPANICAWNPDMYGVRENEPGAFAYYKSIFELYADWGVDFVKCDDICRMDMPSARKEIEFLHQAILASGRDIVLSLSPGPALLDESFIYEKNANMWRITDDLWDEWPLLLAMFKRCEVWQNHVKEGCWPDCDMLPFGQLGHGFSNGEWTSRFTLEEKKTMMSLFCMFRSPLMIGAHLVDLDEETLKLLTNPDILGMTLASHGATQICRTDSYAVWASHKNDSNDMYLAFFNLTDKTDTVRISKSELSDMGFELSSNFAKELWEQTSTTFENGLLSTSLPKHGSCVFLVS